MTLFFMRKNIINHLARQSATKKLKRLEQLKMAKYGEKKQHTYTDPKGKETEFTFQHPGLMGADTILDEIRTDGGKTSIKELRKQLFEHVIRTADGSKVGYAYFEEQEFGGEMLSDVAKAAQDYIFPKA